MLQPIKLAKRVFGYNVLQMNWQQPIQRLRKNGYRLFQNSSLTITGARLPISVKTRTLRRLKSTNSPMKWGKDSSAKRDDFWSLYSPVWIFGISISWQIASLLCCASTPWHSNYDPRPCIRCTTSPGKTRPQKCYLSTTNHERSSNPLCQFSILQFCNFQKILVGRRKISGATAYRGMNKV